MSVFIFGIYYAQAGSVDARGGYTSNGNVALSPFGVRPVVSFNINRFDISDTTKNGTESAPWEIK